MPPALDSAAFEVTASISIPELAETSTSRSACTSDWLIQALVALGAPERPRSVPKKKSTACPAMLVTSRPSTFTATAMPPATLEPPITFCVASVRAVISWVLAARTFTSAPVPIARTPEAAMKASTSPRISFEASTPPKDRPMFGAVRSTSELLEIAITSVTAISCISLKASTVTSPSWARISEPEIDASTSRATSLTEAATSKVTSGRPRPTSAMVSRMVSMSSSSPADVAEITAPSVALTEISAPETTSESTIFARVAPKTSLLATLEAVSNRVVFSAIRETAPMSTSARTRRATAESLVTSRTVTPTKFDATVAASEPALVAEIVSIPPSAAPGPPTTTSAEPSPIRAMVCRSISMSAKSTSKPVTSESVPAVTTTATSVSFEAATETSPAISSVAPPSTSARVCATTSAVDPPRSSVANAVTVLAVVAVSPSEPARIVEPAPTCTVAEVVEETVCAGEIEFPIPAVALAEALSVTAPVAWMSPSTTTEAVAEAETPDESAAPDVAEAASAAVSVTKLIAPLAPKSAPAPTRIDSASTSSEPV